MKPNHNSNNNYYQPINGNCCNFKQITPFNTKFYGVKDESYYC